MNIGQSLPKYFISSYFTGIVHYYLLFFFSLIFIPLPAVAAKSKKVAVTSDQVPQKKGKNKKEKKGEKRRCDIIAYTTLCLENPGKLAKYAAFYHKGAHCIGLNINRIDITSTEGIMHSIYCGRQLKSFAKDSQKATWPLVQRYYTAQSLAEIDFKIYQNYKKEQGNHGSAQHGFLTNLLTNAIMNAIQAARFKKQDAIFDHMVPYMMGLASIKKQVKLSKTNVVMLAMAEPVLWEPTLF